MDIRRSWQPGLLLVLLLVLLGCGGGQSAHISPTPTTKPAAATATRQPTATATTVPCSRAMDPTMLGGQTMYRPRDPCVGAAMQAAFWMFWVWAGYNPPTRFPFLPDATEIGMLATSSYAAQLQAYIQMVQSTEQLTSYTGPQYVQSIQHCQPDGSACTVAYSLGIKVVKTVYNAQTGAVLSEMSGATYGIQAQVEQVYNEEVGQWQINTFTIYELTF